MKFLKTISVAELRQMLSEVPSLNFEEETVDLDDAFGRILSQEIKSPIPVPHFRKSRMDGYAVIASDTFMANEDNSVKLELIDNIQAGGIPKVKVQEGQCAYVATGAAIPEGANAVVMVEFSETDENMVLITQSVPPGTHIINIGHDIKKGDLMCERGRFVDVPTLGILSACGISTIYVYKKPSICLISTGDELVNSDVKNLGIGKIYDVNSNVLKSAIKNAGAEVHYLGIVKDEFEKLKKSLEQGINSSDITILSGGTSKGEGDFAPKVLETFDNIDLLIHGVRIKPGKPFIFAKVGSKIVFVLPGYPTSALSCFYVFIEDFIRRVAKYPKKEKRSISLEVAERIYSTIGRYEFKPVKIIKVDGTRKIVPIKTGSEAINTLFKADGYIEIEELESIVEKGDIKKVYYF